MEAAADKASLIRKRVIAGEYLAGTMFVVCAAWLIFSHVRAWRHQKWGS
jgi:hypothetical protein